MKSFLSKNITKSGLLCISLFITCSTSYVHASAFIHLFEWSWNDIAEECENVLGPKGYSAVQVSPPNEHRTDKGGAWWERYQPLGYNIISRSGNRDEFETMVDRCEKAGVEIYVDLVINHMAGGVGWQFPSVPFDYDDFHHLFDEDPTACRNDNGEYEMDYRVAREVRECDLSGLPDLNTGSPGVRQKIANYINDLIGLGVKGFRIDGSKHMSPQDLRGIIRLVPERANMYWFLEVIRGGADEGVKPEDYLNLFPGVNIDITEFKLENDLAWFFRNGGLRELLSFKNWSEPLASWDAVVFTANHDDQRQHQDRTLTYKDSAGTYYLAQIFMLAYPYGYPKVMSSFKFGSPWYEYPLSGNDKGKDPAHDQGPPANGPNTGDSCGASGGWVCEHRWGGTGNMVGFRNATAAVWDVTNTWSFQEAIGFGRGELGYVLINNNGFDVNSRAIQTGMPAGEYCDIIHGNFNADTESCEGPTITIAPDGIATFSVDAKDAVAIHADAKVGNTCIGPSCNTDITFTCNNGYTYWGQSVYVVGDLAELGNWRPESAIKLNTNGSTYPRWTGTINLPNNTDIEWKCLKRDENQPSQGIQWQPGLQNNQFNSGVSRAVQAGF